MDVKFFIDENLGHDLARGLGLLGYNVEHLLDNFPQGTKDEEWLEYVGKNNLALITKDKAIRRKPNEKALLLKYRVVAFYLGGSERSVKEIAEQLTRAWGKMEAEAKKQFRKNAAGAFIVRPRGGKIDRIPLT